MRPPDFKRLVPGAVLVVGFPIDAVTSSRPRIGSWQVMRIDEQNAFVPEGDVFRRRADAQADGVRRFPSITRWRRVDPQVYVGVVGPSAHTAAGTRGPDGDNTCAFAIERD